MLAGVAALAQDDELQVNLAAAAAMHPAVHGVEWGGGAAEASADLRQGGWHGRFTTMAGLGRADPDIAEVLAGYEHRLGAMPLTLVVEADERWLTRVAGPFPRSLPGIGAALRVEAGGGFTPRLAWFRDLRRRADVVEVSLAHELALTRLGAYLETTAFAGCGSARDLAPGSAGPSARDGYTYAGLRLALPYRVGMHTTVELGAGLMATAGQARAWSPAGRAATTSASARLGVNFDF